MAALDWEPGLDALYEGVLVYKLDPSEQAELEKHRIYQPYAGWGDRTNYDRTETDHILGYMEEVGLVQKNEETNAMVLTELGFQVAIERQKLSRERKLREGQQDHEESMIERQNQLSRTNIRVSGLLVLAVSLQALTGMSSGWNDSLSIAIFVLVVGVAIELTAEWWRSR